MDKEKAKLMVAGIVILVAAFGVVVLVFRNSANQVSYQPPAAAPAAVTPVNNAYLPGIPNTLPLEWSAKVLQNFQFKDPGTGKTQHTRVYISGKTIDADFFAFQKYLQTNGWTITATVDQPTSKELDATKDANRISITIVKDAKTNTVDVNVSYFD